MKPPGADMPVVVTKWYAYAKWVLERVESFPKSQRFILGQRLSNHVMDVLELLVKASYARENKADPPEAKAYHSTERRATPARTRRTCCARPTIASR